MEAGERERERDWISESGDYRDVIVTLSRKPTPDQEGSICSERGRCNGMYAVESYWLGGIRKMSRKEVSDQNGWRVLESPL